MFTNFQASDIIKITKEERSISSNVSKLFSNPCCEHDNCCNVCQECN